MNASVTESSALLGTEIEWYPVDVRTVVITFTTLPCFELQSALRPIENQQWAAGMQPTLSSGCNKMHLYLCCRIEAGSTEVDLEDWDTGLMVTLPLDRFITVAANADQIYKKARKQRRAAENIIPLLATAEHQVIHLQYVIYNPRV